MQKSKALIAGSVLAAISTFGSSVAMAETSVSANVGYVSDYYFRGIYQTSSSASAGLDLGIGGFYAGTWLADVDDGIEYDLYAGYAGEISGFSYDIGYFTYNYTDDWDQTYKELALSVGYGPISVAYADGTYDSSPEQDYSFTSITAEYKGMYATYGTFGKDFDGDYVELGYGVTVSDIDYSIALINNSEELDVKSADGDGETALVFGIGYAWDL